MSSDIRKSVMQIQVAQTVMRYDGKQKRYHKLGASMTFIYSIYFSGTLE